MLKLFKRKGRKVFVIGLDCAPPPVIFKNSAEGPIGLKDQLPNLSRLIEDWIQDSMVPAYRVPGGGCG